MKQPLKELLDSSLISGLAYGPITVKNKDSQEVTTVVNLHGKEYMIALWPTNADA